MANDDRLNEVYLGSFGDIETQRATRERVHWIRSQARGPRVLDAGCSQGMVSILLAREGLDCIGVDNEEDALRFAEEARAGERPEVQRRVRFLRGDARSLDFEDGAFDTVVMGELIEHLVDPEAPLAEARRLLSPDGRLVLTTPFGTMPHPDHKISFGLGNFLQLVLPFFEMESLDVIARAYIAFVGRPRVKGEADLDPEALWRFFNLSDSTFLAREGGHLERVRRRETELRRLQRELISIRTSQEYPWLRRYWRVKRQLVQGGWSDRRMFLEDMAGRVARRLPRRGRKTAVENVGSGLQTWLEEVAAAPGSDAVVFMYSGTTHIQPRRGNRPIRMANVLQSRGIPLLFAYWRWGNEAIPPQPARTTYQLPIDLALPEMARIARHPLGGKKKIFVATFPHEGCARWVNVFNSHGWTTVYECRDEWEEFAKVGQAKWWDANIERYLVNACDVTCCTAGSLQEKMQTYSTGRPVRLSPNALDPAFVSPGNESRLAPRTGPPILGYWGHLTEAWFDWDALEKVARLEPDWRFEIIGHPAPQRSLPPNVVYLGSKDPAEINELCQKWRAAFICFQVGPLADAVDPIKIYEYLALGLPTATLTMPQIHDYPYVFHANDAAGLRAAMARAMEAPLDRDRIDAFLARNRWEDRVDGLLACADELGGRQDSLKRLAGPRAAS